MKKYILSAFIILLTVVSLAYTQPQPFFDPNHDNFTNLTNDTHTQYTLLAGRSSGQTIIGGTDAGDDLILQTTSNASKGDYRLPEMTVAGFVKNDSSGNLTGGNAGNLFAGANGSAITISTQSELIATTSGSVAESADDFLPLGAVYLGFSSRIVTTITGPTNIDIGWSNNDDVDFNDDAFANNLSTLTAGTTTTNLDNVIQGGTIAGDLMVQDQGRKISVTANDSDFTAGSIRVVIWYMESTAPTS